MVRTLLSLLLLALLSTLALAVAVPGPKPKCYDKNVYNAAFGQLGPYPCVWGVFKTSFPESTACQACNTGNLQRGLAGVATCPAAETDALKGRVSQLLGTLNRACKDSTPPSGEAPVTSAPTDE
ncbi:hypothetical protein HDU96_009502 [Phlyctochytrium bullatum]|nr:hypothetical protein HDU96_009502 [Phlyctochytrium bullatum]